MTYYTKSYGLEFTDFAAVFMSSLDKCDDYLKKNTNLYKKRVGEDNPQCDTTFSALLYGCAVINTIRVSNEIHYNLITCKCIFNLPYSIVLGIFGKNVNEKSSYIIIPAKIRSFDMFCVFQLQNARPLKVNWTSAETENES